MTNFWKKHWYVKTILTLIEDTSLQSWCNLKKKKNRKRKVSATEAKWLHLSSTYDNLEVATVKG